jgi:hypothetical protein
VLDVAVALGWDFWHGAEARARAATDVAAGHEILERRACRGSV